MRFSITLNSDDDESAEIRTNPEYHRENTVKNFFLHFLSKIRECALVDYSGRFGSDKKKFRDFLTNSHR